MLPLGWRAFEASTRCLEAYGCESGHADGVGTGFASYPPGKVCPLPLECLSAATIRTTQRTAGGSIARWPPSARLRACGSAWGGWPGGRSPGLLLPDPLLLDPLLRGSLRKRPPPWWFALRSSKAAQPPCGLARLGRLRTRPLERRSAWTCVRPCLPSSIETATGKFFGSRPSSAEFIDSTSGAAIETGMEGSIDPNSPWPSAGS